MSLPPLGSGKPGQLSTFARTEGKETKKIKPPTGTVLDYLCQLVPNLEKHKDCAHWEQFGKCVWCACGQKLYNGTLPKGKQK